MEDKKCIRKSVKEKKSILRNSDIAVLSELAIHKLEVNEVFQRAHTVMVYYPLPDELDMRPFLQRWKDKKNIVLPVVEGDDIRLKCYEGEERIHVGPFGIFEPATHVYYTDYASIDLVVVPGVAFTLGGIRLGRGKGYYDRFLPLLPNAYRIGICYSCQLYETLPFEGHDCKMDDVIFS